MMKLRYALIVLLIAFGAIAPARAQTEDPEQSGRASMAKEDYEQAVLYFSLAIEEEQEQSTRTVAQRSELFFARGSSYFMQGKNDEAIEDFTKAIDLRPKPTSANDRVQYAAMLNLRSQSYLDTNRLGSALRDIDLAIEFAPHISAYRPQRALNLYAMDKLDEALADLNVAIGTVSKDSFLYAFRGAVHEQLGHKDKAKADFDTASKMDKAGAELVKKFKGQAQQSPPKK